MADVRTQSTSRIRSIVTALMGALVLGACMSMPPIATDVDYCCLPGTDGIRTFRVEFRDMPEFLKPMLRDEVSIVMDSKGLEYTEDEAHATLLMSFVYRPLTIEPAIQDAMSENLSPGGGSRFIAEVQMEMTNNVTSERIWSGTMSRIHSVAVGSYMHDAPARTAMREAFAQLFADYPNPAVNDL